MQEWPVSAIATANSCRSSSSMWLTPVPPAYAAKAQYEAGMAALAKAETLLKASKEPDLAQLYFARGSLLREVVVEFGKIPDAQRGVAQDECAEPQIFHRRRRSRSCVCMPWPAGTRQPGCPIYSAYFSPGIFDERI